MFQWVIHEAHNDEFEGEDLNDPNLQSLEVVVASSLESHPRFDPSLGKEIIDDNNLQG